MQLSCISASVPTGDRAEMPSNVSAFDALAAVQFYWGTEFGRIRGAWMGQRTLLEHVADTFKFVAAAGAFLQQQKNRYGEKLIILALSGFLRRTPNELTLI